VSERLEEGAGQGSAQTGSDDCGCKNLLTTGDMARLSGSTLRTVRFYQEEGLLCPAERSDGGHRLFPETELQKLQLALDLREAGLSLGDIKTLFALKSRCSEPEEASRRMADVLERQVEEMQHKIQKLRSLKSELASMVAVISECRSCDDRQFPKRCGECDVLKQQDLPRAVRVLWSDD